ncbi:unnamed protein product [Caenorhabditis auriculariae]|uniref:Uncharacterized protein n=1 Tax=Caenorhabditis auriculariae TaxID=2777116 RepID=A0A8S1HHE6_9PELO|nr:unnamed protein product [Caenorhabditis auriculariae]
MDEVKDCNFHEWRPKIEEAIEKSSFVAIDFEFFGLSSKEFSLFDGSKDRYLKCRRSVEKFHPCQFGIACFKQNPDFGFTVDVFSIPLLKRHSESDSMFSLDAIFLHGVTYCNNEEQRSFKKSISSSDFCSKNDLKEKLDLLLVLFDYEVQRKKKFDEKSSDWFEVDSDKLYSHFDGEVKIALYPHGSYTSENPKYMFLWEHRPDSIEAHIVLHELSKFYPHLHFCFGSQFSKIIAVVKNSVETDSLKLNTKSRLISAFSGVSVLVKAISKNKIPLIGHNCLLDLMYLYNYFIGNLPDDYDQFKNNLNSVFPLIIDTKLLATRQQKIFFKHGVRDLSLDALGDFFSNEETDLLLPKKVVTFSSGKYSSNLFQDGAQYHDASYDAFVTGEVFIKTSHFYFYGENCDRTKLALDLRVILRILRSDVANRIPIPLMDVAHCYLEGTDPCGLRPALIRVEKRRQSWNSFSQSSQIDGEQLEEERRRLNSLVGSFRFDMKLNKNKEALLIASNTANTYARICDHYSKSEVYLLSDEKALGRKFTFEQRLTCFRGPKASVGKDARSDSLIDHKAMLAFSFCSVTSFAILARFLDSA